MFVSRKLYNLQCREVVAAYNRLDMVLAENERLLGLLKLALARRPKAKPAIVEAVPPSDPDTPPSVVMAAIAATFPGDQGVYAANFTYAMSQRHRWETQAEELADEIVKGRT